MPLLNGTIPTASESAYLAYKNVTYSTFKTDQVRSFKPIVQIGLAPNSSWNISPKISTTDQL